MSKFQIAARILAYTVITMMVAFFLSYPWGGNL